MRLLPAQVSTLNFTVQQTLASELLVLCDASGWSPQPIVTLAGPLGANGPPAKIEVSTGANGLYSVQALAMATQGDSVRSLNLISVCCCFFNSEKYTSVCEWNYNLTNFMLHRNSDVFIQKSIP